MGSIAHHDSFRLIRNQRIDSLGVDIAEYEHKVTGAMHYHLAAEHQENVFLVAFRTVPMNSNGVAHILEHTALCGSEKYPVRDPFFMMTRRSLNTFMNAFTSSDWTAYPFASQNRKDYFNLLDVYLDAAFFSRLDPLDFAQEGHRVEFSKADDPTSPLTYKGVVLNEMKGAMSSPVSTLWQTVTKYLFPTATYHHNSGGDPESITDLTYEQLLAFYRTHYHPTNAVFMTFGDIPVEELQQRIETQALSRFEKLDVEISVADEKRYHAPVRVEEAYALEEDDLSGKTHHVMGWLLGKSIDLESQLKAHLLSRVLLDNSASPLRYALESSDLGAAPSPLCGLEDSNREMSFMCGLEGSESGKAAEFEALVMETLKEIAETGVPQEMVEAQLHQLELSQRELSGDGYPYGMNLILTSLSTATHRGDPIAQLNLDPVLEDLREQIKQPDFIQSLIKDWLLENPHRVRVTMRPDDQLAKHRDAAEQAQLDAIAAQMSDEEKQQVIEKTEALNSRQMQVDDESMLPKVTIEDVPTSMRIPEGEQPESSLSLDWYAQGTNGLVYQQVVVDLPELTDEELRLMPLFCYCFSELGCADRDYQQNQQQQAAVTGGLYAYTTMRGATDNEQNVSGYFVLTGKALLAKQTQLTELMHETMYQARFDELKRIREVVAQQRTRKEQSITGSGHSLAMMAASARMSPSALQSHNSRGLESIRHIKQLDELVAADDNALETLSDKFSVIHQKLLNAPRRFLLVGEKEHQQELQQSLQDLWSTSESSEQPIQLSSVRETVKQLWTTSTQVNFCAKAYPTVPVDHPDAAPLTVLGDFLRNGYLHRAIREQGGAYGSGAGQDSGDAVFRFFSYRDPRLTETLDDFDKSLEWLASERHDEQKLEEAILGVVSSIDKPGSPAGEAKQAYHSALFGRTAEQRLAFRARILQVTLADLQRVAAEYLSGKDASIAVVTSPATAEEINADFEVISI